MANTTVTVAGRSATALTSATNTLVYTNVTINTAPGQAGIFSLHDCASVGQAGLHNCVWPIGMEQANVFNATPALATPNTWSVPIRPGVWNNPVMLFTSGITIMTQSDTGLGQFVLVFS